MATLQELKDLALHAARGTAPAEFSKQDVDETLYEEMNKIASDFNSYRRNKYDIFEIIQETADEVVPAKVMQNMQLFAEVKTVPNGQRAQFKVKKGRMRAKRFLTQVGLSGNYEAFRLDTDTVDVTAHAVGGAAYIDFERFLTGDENITEYMDIIVEGLTEATFHEVQKALRASVTANRPTINKYSNTYSATTLFEAVTAVKNYGGGAVIYAPPEFIGAMGPDAIVPAISGAQGIYSPDDIAAIHNTGYVSTFRGTPIVQIQQSFEDETNTKVMVDPSIAYIFPTGGEKVVKVVFEGNTLVKEYENRDNSMEIQAYKKLGVAILTYNNWATYKNTGISTANLATY